MGSNEDQPNVELGLTQESAPALVRLATRPAGPSAATTAGARLPPLYESKWFRLDTGTLSLDKNFRGIFGYIVVSKRTGVVEQETNSEAMGMRLCHRLDKLMDAVLEDPDGTKEDEETKKRQPPAWAERMMEQDFQGEPGDEDQGGGSGSPLN